MTNQSLQKHVRHEWADAAPAVQVWNKKMMIQGRATSEALIEAAQVKPGAKVLDIASGSGEPAVSIAERVGENGHVIASDATPALLEIARRLAMDRGMHNISFENVEMENLPFPDDAFDIVTCRFGIMYTTDLERTLAEIKRVLRPEGRAAFTVWGPLEENPYFSIPLAILARHVVFPTPDPDAPNPFLYARIGSLSERVRAARFHDVNEEARTVPFTWPGPVKEVWTSFQELGKPFQKIMEGMSPREAYDVEREMTESISRYYDGKQVNFPASIILVSGTK